MPLIIPANSITGGYEVDNSLRFNAGDSEYLSRTPASTTDTKTWTWSGWVKLNKISQAWLFGAYSSGSLNTKIYLDGSNNLNVHTENSTVYRVQTDAVLRDFSAWYHIVVAFDTTQATESNRIKIYINETLQSVTEEASGYPAQNWNGIVNNNSYEHNMGYEPELSYYFDGYMAEVCFIDGTALDPTSFGEFDADTGIWKPIDVSGLTFGTNGFYLDFENSGSLGADVSGNGNNFTVNNLTSIDQSTDTPTNNFATLNSISEHNDSTFSDGNLTYTGNAAAVHMALGSIGVTQGKWYFEAKRLTGSSAYPFVGVFKTDGTMGSYLGQTVDGWTILMDATNNGEWRNNDTLSGTSAGTFVNGNIAMIAIDMDNGKIWFGKDGTWAASGDPSAGTGEQYSNLTGTIIPAVAVYTGASISFNFGSPPFTISSGNSDGNGYGNFEYAVPSGYYALNTKNLAEYG